MVKSDVIGLTIKKPKMLKRVKERIVKVFRILKEYIIPLYSVYEIITELIKYFLMKVSKKIRV